MDIITQALLGAVCAKAIAGRRLQRVAYWGALGGIVPDLDVLVRVVGGEWAGMLHHRGVSHSLWFGPVFGPLLGYLVWRFYRRSADAQQPGQPGASTNLRLWMAVFVASIWTHPMLDVFTAYGTQLLAPFSRQRFALNGIGIVDPFYTLVLVAALVAERLPRLAKRASRAALLVTTLYLLLGVHINKEATSLAKSQLPQTSAQSATVVAYPTVMQIFLRRVVAKQGDAFAVGWVSLWEPRPIRWFQFRQDVHPFVERLRASEKGQLFEWFCNNRSAARVRKSPSGYTIELSDTRYGSMSEPRESLWGIRANYDATGKLTSPIARYRRPLPGGLGTWWKSLWRAAFPAKQPPGEINP